MAYPFFMTGLARDITSVAARRSQLGPKISGLSKLAIAITRAGL